jgi:hypothetical protein
VLYIGYKIEISLYLHKKPMKSVDVRRVVAGPIISVMTDPFVIVEDDDPADHVLRDPLDPKYTTTSGREKGFWKFIDRVRQYETSGKYYCKEDVPRYILRQIKKYPWLVDTYHNYSKILEIVLVDRGLFDQHHNAHTRRHMISAIIGAGHGYCTASISKPHWRHTLYMSDRNGLVLDEIMRVARSPSAAPIV